MTLFDQGRSSDDARAWELARSRKERMADIAWGITRVAIVIALVLCFLWVSIQ